MRKVMASVLVLFFVLSGFATVSFAQWDYIYKDDTVNFKANIERMVTIPGGFATIAEKISFSGSSIFKVSAIENPNPYFDLFVQGLDIPSGDLYQIDCGTPVGDLGATWTYNPNRISTEKIHTVATCVTFLSEDGGQTWSDIGGGFMEVKMTHAEKNNTIKASGKFLGGSLGYIISFSLAFQYLPN